MGQLDTRPPASLRETFPPAAARRLAGSRATAPAHGSWLNAAELAFGVLARGLPGRTGGRPTRERRARAWEQGRNEVGVAARRRFTTADARIEPLKLHPASNARRGAKAACPGSCQSEPALERPRRRPWLDGLEVKAPGLARTCPLAEPDPGGAGGPAGRPGRAALPGHPAHARGPPCNP